MNRDETKKAIEVMQAFVDGAEIEVRYFGLFNDERDQVASEWQKFTGSAEPLFNWDSAEYRIKPQEPREFWIKSDIGYAVEVEPENKNLSRYIKVREVL